MAPTLGRGGCWSLSSRCPCGLRRTGQVGGGPRGTRGHWSAAFVRCVCRRESGVGRRRRHTLGPRRALGLGRADGGHAGSAGVDGCRRAVHCIPSPAVGGTLGAPLRRATCCRCGQPAPHCAHRPTQRRRDRPMPRAGGLGHQGRADHDRRISTTHQHRGADQHMRAPAPRARRTTRTPHEHHRAAARVVVAADATGPGVAPRPQLTGAPRTMKHPTMKESVDLWRVRTYDQQRVSPSTKRRTFHPAKDQREGRYAYKTSSRSRRQRERATPQSCPKRIITVSDAN